MAVPTSVPRRALTLATAVALAVGMIPTAAVAGNPSAGSTSVGQALTVQIDAPADGARLDVAQPVSVSGTATIGATATAPVTVAYVVDQSGSTNDQAAPDLECDGTSPGGQAGDDVNGDTYVGRVLDCELSSILALNQSLASRANVKVGYVGFASEARFADMSPAGGYQGFASPADPAVAQVVRSATTRVPINPNGSRQFPDNPSNPSVAIGLHTAVTLGAAGTDYLAAFLQLRNLFAASTGERVVYFLSDGEPTEGYSVTDPSFTSLRNGGVRFHTYSVGAAGPGCATTGYLGTSRPSPLYEMASVTGGTCTEVGDPSALTAALRQPATITGVEVRVGSGPVQTASVDPASGAWSTSIGGLVPGPNVITATVVASDGSRVTSDVTVTGMSAPAVEAGGPYVTTEGTAVAFAGASVSDADSPTPTTAWSPADGLDDPALVQASFSADDDVATRTLTLTATDADGLVGADTTTVTVVNAPPVLGPAAIPSTIDEGRPFTLTLPYSDAGAVDTHTAIVEWGDGTSTPLQDATGDGGGTVSADHTYVADGTYTITVTVTDDDGGSASAQIGPFETNGTPSVAPQSFLTDEGAAPFGVTVAASDPETATDALTYAFSGGAGRLSPTDARSATYTPAGDDLVDVYDLSVSDGRLAATTQVTFATRNVAPAASAALVAPSAGDPRLGVGGTARVAITLTDPGADVLEVSVDWGDGTSSSHAGLAPGSTLVAEHPYAVPGTFVPRVVVRDDDGGTGAAPAPAVTVVAPPAVDAGGPYTFVEGTTGVLSGASVTSAVAPHELTFDWDGSPRLSDTTALAPAYDAADDADETVRLTVSDGLNEPVSALARVTVANLAPAASVAVPASEITGRLVQLTGSFTDPGPLDTHSATVDWGDGTVEPATLSGGDISASHRYAGAGHYTIVLTVSDDDGGSGTATAQHEAVNRPPVASAGADRTVAEGSAIVLEGAASDPDGDALDLSWTPSGQLSGADTATPTFTGADDGTTVLTITATDPYGATASDDATVTTTNVAPAVGASGPDGPTRVGVPVAVTATFTDPGAADTHAATIDWGDGTSGAGAVTGGDVAGEHAYVTPGVYTVTVTVTDDDGGSGSATVAEVVVVDPDAGCVTGGGQIAPPRDGKVTFSAGAKYGSCGRGEDRGGETPTGGNVLQVHAQGMTFRSTALDWLVVSGEQATYRGVGTVDGEPGYAFEVRIVDARTNADDRYGIRIWDTSGASVYSSGLQPLSAGNVAIHRR